MTTNESTTISERELHVPLGARLRASWQVDGKGTLIGFAVAVIIMLTAFYAIVAITSRLGEAAEVSFASFPDSFALLMVVLAIVMNADAASVRRESVLGGWTRRESMQTLTVVAAIFGGFTTLGWLALTAISPLANEVLVSVTGWDNAVIAHQVPAMSLPAAFFAGLTVFAASYLPRIFNRLAGVHWSAVVAGAILLVPVQAALFSAYFLNAYPNDNLLQGTVFGTQLWLTSLLAIGACALVVAATYAYSRTATIRRYRA